MHSAPQTAADLVRARIVRGEVDPAAFRAALSAVPSHNQDSWLDSLWDSGELPDDDARLPRGCVPYLPCPVGTVLQALQQAAVTAADVFVDVGSGLGRTTFLAHLLTGAGCIGLEIQSALVQAARARAAWLDLSRTRFVEGDAVDLVRFMTIGTVFFLYCPFGADRLHRLLDDLEEIACTRQIRVCCVDLPRLDCPWLAAVPSDSVELTVYRSTHASKQAAARAPT